MPAPEDHLSLFNHRVTTAKIQIRDGLNEIAIRTSAAAFQQEPHLKISTRRRGGLLGAGVDERRFCSCARRHLVSREAFQILPEGRKKLVLWHFASVWLADTLAYMERAYASLAVFGSAHVGEIQAIGSNIGHTQWAKATLVEAILEVFKFQEEVPKIFQSWINAALAVELGWLENRARSGFFRDRQKPHPLRYLRQHCRALAEAIADEFRAKLERKLKDLKGMPEGTDHTLLTFGDRTPSKDAAPALAATHVSKKRALTEFEMLAGSLFDEALQASPKRVVVTNKLLSIADQLDNSSFHFSLEYLERKHHEEVASYNQKHSLAAIKTWKQLAKTPAMRRGFRRLLAHLGEKVRENRRP